jgi:hypothetical protein
MAAPTNAASEDSPCQPGAVHTWPISEVATRSIEVRSVRPGGLYLLKLSSSHFDPKRTPVGSAPTLDQDERMYVRVGDAY